MKNDLEMFVQTCHSSCFIWSLELWMDGVERLFVTESWLTGESVLWLCNISRFCFMYVLYIWNWKSELYFIFLHHCWQLETLYYESLCLFHEDVWQFLNKCPAQSDTILALRGIFCLLCLPDYFIETLFLLWHLLSVTYNALFMTSFALPSLSVSSISSSAI